MAIYANKASSQYVSFGSNSSLNSVSEQTIMGWFRIPPSTGFEFLFNHYDVDGSNNAYGWTLYLDNNGYLSCAMADGYIPTSRLIRAGNVALDDNVYHHLTAVLKAGTGGYMRLYVDGQEITYGSTVGSVPATIGQPSVPTTFARVSSQGSLIYATCAGADLRLYQQALPAAAIANIYAHQGADRLPYDARLRALMMEGTGGSVASGAGSVRDSSNYGNHGTPYNNPAYDTQNPAGHLATACG